MRNGKLSKEKRRNLKTLLDLLSGYYIIILIGIFCIALLFTIMILL